MGENISVKEIYKALECLDFEKFDEIYFSIKEEKYKFSIEEIVLLCEIFTKDFKYIEPHQIRKIIKMTYFTINEYEIHLALKELIIGLKTIYNKSLTDNKKNKLDFSYEDFIDEYIGMFINSYKVDDIIIFGSLLNSEDSKDFKVKIVEIIKNSMEYEEDEYITKGKTLIENIKI